MLQRTLGRRSNGTSAIWWPVEHMCLFKNIASRYVNEVQWEMREERKTPKSQRPGVFVSLSYHTKYKLHTEQRILSTSQSESLLWVWKYGEMKNKVFFFEYHSSAICTSFVLYIGIHIHLYSQIIINRVRRSNLSNFICCCVNSNSYLHIYIQ